MLNTPKNTPKNITSLEETLNSIQKDISSLNSSLIPSEILLNEIDNLKVSQQETKEDLREIKKMLLDPNDGIIVKVNKNTEFRIKEEIENKEHLKFLNEHSDLVKWKNGISRLFWIIISAVVTSYLWLLSKLPGQP
jgi:aspartate carbamoyltransferase regulatory subunit